MIGVLIPSLYMQQKVHCVAYLYITGPGGAPSFLGSFPPVCPNNSFDVMVYCLCIVRRSRVLMFSYPRTLSIVMMLLASIARSMPVAMGRLARAAWARHTILSRSFHHLRRVDSGIFKSLDESEYLGISSFPL